MRVAVSLLTITIVLAQDSPKPDLNSFDLEAINKDVRPCDDFYEHAIGRWHAQHPIPASQVRWGKRWAAAEYNRDVLRDLVETVAAKSSTGNTNERLIGTYFNACMKTKAIDALGNKPIQPALERIRLAFTREALKSEIAKFAAEDIPLFALMSATPDSDQPDRMILGIYASPLGLPDRDYYLKDDAKAKADRERYSKHLAKMFELAGLDPAKSSTVLQLETELAKSQLSRVERRNPYNVKNYMSPQQLADLAPAFPWAELFRSTGTAPGSVLNVMDKKYLERANQMLATAPLDDLKTMLAWQVIRFRGNALSQPFRDEIFDFRDRYLGGAKEPHPRWKVCVNEVDSNLGLALGRVYVDRYFPAAAKTRMQEMVKNIKLAMKDTITELPWMGQATREKALAKLASLEPQVGYPDAWRPYTGLKLDAGSHFANFEMTERWSVRDRLGEVGKPVDRNRWGMTTPTSNAYYSAIRKEIVFPAGILIPPMFNLEADDAVNYGAIGVVIGHEISHAFDDQGSQYDADGRLKNWWTPEDRKLFLEKAECVVDQFNNYFIEPGVAHNGKLVLGESIGDLAGARIAFRAYMKSLEGKPRPPVIGGFTPEQRFFLSWGQSRGDSTRLETQRLMVVTDPHPVAKWRVNGPLSNLPEFQKAFGCEAGNGMVRSGPKRCDVW